MHRHTRELKVSPTEILARHERRTNATNLTQQISMLARFKSQRQFFWLGPLVKGLKE